MHVAIVDVHVKPGHRELFLEACRENHESSIRETGNLRFDVLEDASDCNHFVLYEAYASEELSMKHKETAHYLKWRETVADWMARPRVGRIFIGHFPELS